jgi:segregation and condensation protein B
MASRNTAARKTKESKRTVGSAGTSAGEPAVVSDEIAAARAEEAEANEVGVAAEVAETGPAREEEIPDVQLAANATDEEITRVSVALVFASDKPLTVSRIAELLGHSPARIRAALTAFNELLRSIGAPFHAGEIAGGFRFLTDDSMSRYVAALRGEQKKERLSAAGLETLAIVAYRQPVSKAEIEAMRGVQAGPILRTLLDRRLIRVTGRAPVPGRPLQYGTTKEFLDRFHLASLKDLPTVEELTKP